MVKFSNTVKVADILEAFDAIDQDPDFHLGLNKLTNMSEVETVDISTDDLKQLADTAAILFARRMETGPGAKIQSRLHAVWALSQEVREKVIHYETLLAGVFGAPPFITGNPQAALEYLGHPLKIDLSRMETLLLE